MFYPVSVCGIIHRNVSLFKHSIKKKETKTSKWLEETDSFHSFSSSPLCPLGGVEVHAKKRTKDLMKPLNNDLLCSITQWVLLRLFYKLGRTACTSVEMNQYRYCLFSLNRGKRRTNMHVLSAQTLCSLMLDASCFQDLLGNWVQMIQVLLINWHAIIKSSQ